MSDRSEWSLTAPQKLTFEEPVTALNVRVVGGTVNVVGTDGGPAGLELSAIDGPPLIVTRQGGTLTVAYEDLPWQNFLKWFDRKGWKRSVTVTLTVPTATRVELGVVGANAVVSGITGATDVRGVTGDTTLVGVRGDVRAETVSGHLQAQALGGGLRFNSVSGDLTLIESASASVKAETVSGDMTVDLSAGAPAHPTLELTSVSGEVAVRLPHPVDAEVNANTTSGRLSCAFDDLRVSGQWGAKRITGRLGAGHGRLKVTTISGAVALLRRPPSPEDVADVPVQGKVL
ncbi:DUF4097 family beta strand repeat-containing protein [Streptomyces griseocarneus]|uniref:DUF4097 family beta strand repeat-containing protein n=1 Tax=Streptomyces griseocarneus TaxID=51201 RepID=UPI00167D2D6B|nr:DUF4097 family beta strand repeat-containing protein [Streptomyces griseocarneus]MBZ6473436.1 DUF4097 domain-containing protein [Streptomyces griseocarneus]GHG56886.1 hypothetical protein GCM10018779_21550 [Streptomyces griseocarneus]